MRTGRVAQAGHLGGEVDQDQRRALEHAGVDEVFTLFGSVGAAVAGAGG
ncbi:hypothetical protein AB0C76_39680 [Kitasatospora sp. NPDC048722]